MATSAGAPTVTSISGDEHRRQLRRAVLAATIGTAIEWYDFFLYSTVTAWCLPALFSAGRSSGRHAPGIRLYAVGFLARPVGAAIFGHYGDRVGSKGRADRDAHADGRCYLSGRPGPKL